MSDGGAAALGRGGTSATAATVGGVGRRVALPWLRERANGWPPGAILALLLTLPSWLPILWPSFSVWALYDGANHLRKAYFLSQLIRDGNWYPRWVPQEYGGYGYPTFSFYAAGTYYLMLGWAALTGAGLYGAFQAMSAIAALGIVSGVYALAWGLWRHAPAAVLTAAAVAYAPYIFPNNLFISGWLPQLLGQALTVWLLVECLWLWRGMAEGLSIAGCWWAIAVTTAAMLLTHNASAAIAAPMAASWLACLWLWRRSSRGLALAGTAAVAGAAWSAVLWLPVLLDAGLVQVERMYRGNLNYRNHFLIWPGHNPPLWGLQERSPYTAGWPIDLHLLYPNSAYGPTKLGLWQGVLFLVGAITLSWVLWSGRRIAASVGVTRRLAALSLGFGLLVFLVSYSQSFDWWLPAWERFAALRALQLPSRFLVAAGVGVALAAGASLALWLPRGRRAWLLAAAAVAVLGISSVAHRPLPLEQGVSHTMDAGTVAGFQRSQPGFSDSTEEFLPRTASYDTFLDGEARGFWLYEKLFPEASWTGGRLRTWQGDVAVRGIRGRLLWTEAEVEAGPTGGVIALHQLDFPGWRVWLDGRPVPGRVTPWIQVQAIQPGFLLVDVPPGAHRVTFAFGPDGPRLAGAIVSLLSLLASAAWLMVGAGRLRSVMTSSVFPVARTKGRHLGLIGGAAIGVAALIAGGRLVLSTMPPTASSADAVMVENVIDAVQSGRAAIDSPSGSVLGPDKFVDVRYLTLQAQDRPLRDAGPSTRRWLYTHPPTTVSVDVAVPNDAYFQAGLAIDPQVWNAPTGDGVRYEVTVTPASGAPAQVFRLVVNPRAQGEQRRWLDIVADMTPWAGQSVRLTLHTDPRQDPTYDWAGWSEPSVVRLDALTAARLLDSTAKTIALVPGAATAA